ncbi:MAG: PleD family two-component system response regulator [Candidatus Thorarchaeota archaeon]
MTTRILLVDDDLAVPKLIGIYLRSYLDDFMIDTMGNGEDTIDMIKGRIDSNQANALPNITILDYRMPGVGGLEVAAELSNLGLKNIYLMTAYISPELIAAAQLAGARGIMKKSEGFNEVAKKIADIARTMQT